MSKRSVSASKSFSKPSGLERFSADRTTVSASCRAPAALSSPTKSGIGWARRSRTHDSKRPACEPVTSESGFRSRLGTTMPLAASSPRFRRSARWMAELPPFAHPMWTISFFMCVQARPAAPCRRWRRRCRGGGMVFGLERASTHSEERAAPTRATAAGAAGLTGAGVTAETAAAGVGGPGVGGRSVTRCGSRRDGRGQGDGRAVFPAPSPVPAGARGLGPGRRPAGQQEVVQPRGTQHRQLRVHGGDSGPDTGLGRSTSGRIGRHARAIARCWRHLCDSGRQQAGRACGHGWTGGPPGSGGRARGRGFAGCPVERRLSPAPVAGGDAAMAASDCGPGAGGSPERGRTRRLLT